MSILDHYLQGIFCSYVDNTGNKSFFSELKQLYGKGNYKKI